MSETERRFNPPLRRVTLVPNWLDDLVVAMRFDNIAVDRDQRMGMGSALLLDRHKPLGPDEVERTVDDYHQRFILDPATRVAGIAMRKEIKVAYAPQTEGAATDLRVCDESTGGINYIVAEDKRGLVWQTHESKLLALLQRETVPIFRGNERPLSEVRICIQVSDSALFCFRAYTDS
jgi:hypothetical protein